ncbi:MAG TPA: AraC family transcriptional regulator [Bdellovibrio sp.]|uniref:AraC family transcriptional regulator n=1 Tax=Bdellovibrio sp. TaxID=28201 RepID=UPI002EF59C57
MKRHSISSLGVKHAIPSDIRVELLQDRLTPRVPFPHKHDFYQIVIIFSGTGWHEIDFTSYKVSKQQLFVIKPGQVHSWKLATKTKGFVIEYTDASFSKAYTEQDQLSRRSRALPDQVKFRPEDSLSLEFLKLMEAEFRHQKAFASNVLQNYLSIFLWHLLRVTGTQTVAEASKQDIVSNFLDLVELHFRKQHSLEFYAGTLNVSPKTLSAKILKALGKPAKEVISERCLLEAKRLLAYSSLTISEIGYELGFDDPNYFSRFLKQHMKTSAQQFRAQAQKKPN